ncbi:MAG: ABC transporter permease [Bacteroidota bacterium]
MLHNYFKIAIRHLTRHRLFSAINILCLSLGITFALLIGVYVINEKNVNGGLKDVADQYVMKSKWKQENLGLDITSLAPLAKAMKESYPNLVDGYYRYNPVTNIVSAGDNHFKEDIAIGDTTLVSTYGFKLLYGNEKQAFRNNQSAVITETLAMKLYGKKDAIDQTITITNTTGSKQDYIVSAVLQTLPTNSVTNFISGDGYDVFLPTEGNHYFQGTDPMESWSNVFMVCMIKLKQGTDPAQLVRPFAQTIHNRADASIRDKFTVELSPVKDYYLTNNNGAIQKMIITLSFIAGFILLMAIINFININIGTSTYRLKEIGLRKVFGGEKKQLVFQYMSESLVLTAIAALFSLFMYQALLPLGNQVMNTTLPPVWKFDGAKFGFLALLVLIVGIVSGIYPALVLSSSNTIHAIKGKINDSRGGMFLRKSLLVVQFSLAIVVFINALNISKQVTYCFTRDLGYNKDQVLVISAIPKQWDSAGVLKMETIRNELIRIPSVQAASLSFEVPDRKPPNSYDLLPEGASFTQPVNIPATTADENYAAAFQLKMKEGVFFRQDAGYVPGQIVLNESAVKALGLSSPVGKKIRIPSANASLTVVGVIKDYNYSSLQERVGPIAFANVKDIKSYRYISVKLTSTDISKSMALIKDKWKAMAPSAPFEYFFMDEKFQSLYSSELQLQKAARIATWLTMIIVFLGIFGVVAFTLTKRNKEIAVRKVLGAGAGNIISLFIRDYALLILIANIVAWPLAFSITNQWLKNYAYRIEQSWGTFVLVGGITFLSAFLFIALQCYRTALANPVKSLRTE